MLSEMLFVNYQLKVFHRPANGMVSLNMICLGEWSRGLSLAGNMPAGVASGTISGMGTQRV